ncbi:MAG: hypothetical protein ACLUPK_02170 [Veillonella sp.]
MYGISRWKVHQVLAAYGELLTS